MTIITNHCNDDVVKSAAYLIKYDDPHDLALDDDDPALVVDAHAARMLQNVCAELADKLAVLVVDLDLERRAI